MRDARFILSALALVAVTSLTGCLGSGQVAQNATGGTSGGTSGATAGGTSTLGAAHRTLPSGSSIDVSLATALTSETASVGSTWSGSVRNASVLDGHDVIPAGSPVTGTVTSVTPARKGDRAMLDLGLTSVTVGDHSYRVHGSMESVVAGSPRARNLGAIGAATAAGAVVGHAIGGSGKGTLIGAIVGGGAATGVVSQTKGWQVVLKEGTPLTFTTSEALAVRQ